MRQLANVKRDVVDTIRQVVDVVSKYAGVHFPSPLAHASGIILRLPQAWASASRRQGQQPDVLEYFRRQLHVGVELGGLSA